MTSQLDTKHYLLKVSESRHSSQSKLRQNESSMTLHDQFSAFSPRISLQQRHFQQIDQQLSLPGRQ